jgi:signal transduction histidine kinase
VKSVLPHNPALFYAIRLRHAVALLVCLGVILVLAGYFSVSAGQKAALEAIIAQGRALTETLLSSAQMVIEFDDSITMTAIDKLIAVVNSFNVKKVLGNDSELDDWRQALGADKVDLVINRKIRSSSSTRLISLNNDNVQRWLDSLMIDPDDEIIYDFHDIGENRYFWGYFSIDDTTGLFAAIDWKYGRYGNEKLSLSYLLNQVGQEAGVEYIMLQNQDGIVFASKKIASMPKLTDDPFLIQSLSSDTTSNRVLVFQGRQVLETVKVFKARDFDGVFRVGLSLYGYSQIAAGVKRQVWFVVAALIVLGMLGFGLIAGFQNYDLLRAGLDKARIISQGLLDSIPGPVLAVDSHLRITDINSMARNSLGIPPAILSGSEYSVAFPDDPFHFAQIMIGKRSASFEKTMGVNDHQYYITTTPLISPDGRSLGAIAIAQDITDVRTLEGMAESRRRLSELGALAASMAHEIRNPLNAIGITIQRMRNEIQPASSQDEFLRFLDGLKSEIKRLNDIIEKFLAVARSVRPEIAPISVRELISNVVELFKSQAESQKTSLAWQAPGDITFECDHASLTQALVNIVKNSLEALGSGGNIQITASAADDKVRITVDDDGPGILDIASAMKPFYTTKKNGTGLGLATASKILADHGGELVIESSSGKGCRVDFLIPRKKVDG